MSAELMRITEYGFSVLQIETAATCNMQCKFCIYPIRGDKGKVLPRENILELIDSLAPDSRLEYICFTHFNEPLLDERIFTFIKHAKERQLPVMIITNGLLLNSQDMINKLISVAADYIKISLQTVNEELFREARGTAASFKEYKTGIFEFLKQARGGSSSITLDLACNFLSGFRGLKTAVLGLERGDPSVYNTVAELRSDARTFLRELKDYNPDFEFKISGLGGYLDRVKMDYSNENGFSLAENISLKIKPFIYGKRLTEFYPLKEGAGCRNRILAVLASGEVAPCCLAYDGMLSMGNIKRDSLKTILQRNAAGIERRRKGKQLSLTCRRCLGAPTRRGAFVKYIRAKLSKR